MSQRHSDHNLLFGILAVQMDFISREQLIAAMNAWVLNKAEPLAQILMDCGQLSAERRVLLEALVNEHLKQHHGDSQQSLAAIGLVDALHGDLKQLRDSDIQASLANVSIAHSIDPYATVTPETSSQALANRFQILRPHARGGLGLVSVALDHELSREVAFKEIQSRHAHNPDSRRRFVLEAEITGGLEHPGIVPVYSFGKYPDGRPFYAMRFIQGTSLKTAIETYHGNESKPQEQTNISAGQPELRKLLLRFVDVCDAIAYAHSRGVLHRDLKPSNIMLGKYGETLVVDWGLAKPLGHRDDTHSVDEATLQPPSASSGSGETLPGSALGTPAYMSPEQAAGRLGDIGPASDVYSLGVTLYHLLVGKTPFEGSTIEEILRRVQVAEYARPTEVLKGIPPALEAVCLKAMSLKPSDRYLSTRALADDIEHWLADERVTAYHESRTERLGRWARRHREFIPYSLTIVILMVAILLGRIVFLERETRQQRRDEELESTALFHAGSVAFKIKTCSAELRERTGDSEFKTLLVRANEMPADGSNLGKVQSWLDNRAVERFGVFRPSTLFINSADGTQLASSPPGNSTGQNFRHRDYFHGRGHNLPIDKANDVGPIQGPYVSISHSSIASRFSMTFSVPIWNDGSGAAEKQVIGVLGIIVDGSEFVEFDILKGFSKTVHLINLNEDFFEGEARRGLILQKYPSTDAPLVRIDDALVSRLLDVRAKRALQLNTPASISRRREYSDPDEVHFEYQYRDPLPGISDRTESVAAFAPIFVSGAEEEILNGDTGLVVVVQEK